LSIVCLHSGHISLKSPNSKIQMSNQAPLEIEDF